MSDDTVIRVDGVSKKFCRSLKRSMLYGFHDIAKDALGIRANGHKLRTREFWAVDNISFELKRGQTLGLIGPNGSGKTTLLKMLNGIILPDRGRVEVKGRVGALIAVGAGFHPQLTGRENIYINGAILGMGKCEIDKKFDEIVEFADIGDFLDTPIKHYSSGMYVRLGFAVAVHCEPDILLTDEVLAVGDYNFQIKCYQKMHEIRKRGTTIILVSHSIITIREQTERCLYINHGRMRFSGSSEDATDIYIKDTLEQRSKKVELGEKNNGFSKARVSNLKFFDKFGSKISSIESGKEFNAVIECEVKSPLREPIFGVNFYDDRGFQYSANSYYERIPLKEINPGKFHIKINFPHFHLPYSNYLCSVVIAEESPANLIDWHDKMYRFIVTRATGSRGHLKLPTKWEIEPL